MVGPSGCGKTTIWKVLKIDLEKIGQAKNIFDEPKSNAKNTIYMFHEQRHKEFSEAVFDSISE